MSITNVGNIPNHHQRRNLAERIKNMYVMGELTEDEMEQLLEGERQAR